MRRVGVNRRTAAATAHHHETLAKPFARSIPNRTRLSWQQPYSPHSPPLSCDHQHRFAKLAELHCNLRMTAHVLLVSHLKQYPDHLLPPKIPGSHRRSANPTAPRCARPHRPVQGLSLNASRPHEAIVCSRVACLTPRLDTVRASAYADSFICSECRGPICRLVHGAWWQWCLK